MVLYAKETFLEGVEFPFAVMPYHTLPTRPPQPHYHDFIEMVYVADGHGEHSYKGRSYPINKGDFLVIPPGAEHDYRVSGEEPLTLYNLIFLPELLTSELAALSAVTPFVQFFYLEPFLRANADFDSHLKLSLLEGREVKGRLDRLVREFEAKELGYRISIKALLIELLVFLSRCYDKRVVEPVFHSNESRAIEQLCAFIEEHYAQPLTLEQVCRMCGMSQTTFTVKFKAFVGKSFVRYRNEVRIHASLKLLRETEDNIVDIAGRAGIDDLSHFNKLFKQHLRMTPGQYRSRYRGGD